MKEANIPQLCSLIHAENILDNVKAGKIKQQKEPAKKSTQAKSSKGNRLPIVPKIVEKKFEYDDGNMSQDFDNEEDIAQTHKTKSQTAAPESSLNKKSRIVKKTFDL